MSKWRSVPKRFPLRYAAFVVLTLLTLAYGRTLAPGITWANQGLDSAELAAVALVRGVAHPSGYPTYLLVADLFLALPGSEPAFKLNLLSATAAIATALVLSATVYRLAPVSPWRPFAAALAGLSLGLAPLFWSQAVITEVYTLSALGAACISAATLLLALGLITPAPRRDTVIALWAGLILGTHVTLAPFSLLWLAVASFPQGRLSFPAMARQGVGFAGGLLVYLSLPLRAAAEPAINWGGAQTWDGFWWLVSGQLYAGMAFGLPAEDVPVRMAHIARLLVAQTGLLGLALIGYGLVRARLPRGWLARSISLVPAGVLIVFMIGYNSFDATVYLVLALPSLLLWLGLGLVTLLADLEHLVQTRLGVRMAPSPWNLTRAFPHLVALSVAVGLLAPVPTNLAQVNARFDLRAIAYAQAVFTQAPNRSLILTFRDQDSFPLWYYHLGQGKRPDLVIVTAPLLGFDWYRASLRATYPQLNLPDLALAGWEDALMRQYAADGPICRIQLDQAPPLVCMVDAPPIEP